MCRTDVNTSFLCHPLPHLHPLPKHHFVYIERSRCNRNKKKKMKKSKEKKGGKKKQKRSVHPSTATLFQYRTGWEKREELGRYAYKNTSKTRVERGERWTTTTTRIRAHTHTHTEKTKRRKPCDITSGMEERRAKGVNGTWKLPSWKGKKNEGGL